MSEGEQKAGRGSSWNCIRPGQAVGRGQDRGREETTSGISASPEAWAQRGNSGSLGHTCPSPSVVPLSGNYLLKNGTSDVLLCGNSSDAGYVAPAPQGHLTQQG